LRFSFRSYKTDRQTDGQNDLPNNTLLSHSPVHCATMKAFKDTVHSNKNEIKKSKKKKEKKLYHGRELEFKHHHQLRVKITTYTVNCALCCLETAHLFSLLINNTGFSPRHRFFSVSLCLQANAEMVPNIPSCHYMLLM